jgi:hypothetical protein
MTGLTIKYDKWSRNIFRVLFRDIDFSLWDLDIYYWESYNESKSKVDLNKLVEIPSKLAKQELLENDCEIIPEFTKLLIRYYGSKKAEIKTYEQFIKSQYFLAIIIIDHRNIEICCKDEDLLVKIKCNFLNSSLENKRFEVLFHIPANAVLDPWRSKKDVNIYDELFLD